MLLGMAVDVATDVRERASTPAAERASTTVRMKAVRQHADPMEGLWVGMFLSVPFWATLLYLVR